MLCLGLLAVLVFLGTSSPLLGAVTVGFAAIFALIVCLD
ncbi:MAG: hypothetical protein JWR83_1500, partial [Aeromicrobium sp.]|nr:hypothetical protein [Aeromicrobium sp.]